MPDLESLFFKFTPAPLRRFIREQSIAFVKSCLIPPILRKRVELEERTDGISVHLLVSAGTFQMGLLAIRSFQFFTGRHWQVFVHDDGSLTQRDQEEISQVLPKARFVGRAEADEKMAGVLTGFPHCARLRSQHNWFLKIFDLVQFVPGSKFIVLDSDLLFFDLPPEILRWAAEDETGCWFNRDGKEVYAYPRAVIEERWPHPLWNRVNSGLCLLQKSAIDLARCEDFLNRLEGEHGKFMFLEQTLFAVNASAAGPGGMLPPQYEISWGNFRKRDGICRHYVGVFKHDVFFLEGVVTLFWRMFLTHRDAPARARLWPREGR